MDINKLHPIKISGYAKEKVIKDFFPTLIELDLLNDESLSDKDLSLHAGAFCLYVATLITKIYETNPEDIEIYSIEREQELYNLIKNSSKYINCSEEQISNIVHEIIIKDVRNCFAHGNFDISYDIHTKKLFFVLTPRRKDYISNKPIVISKESLLKANMRSVEKIGEKLSLIGPNNLHSLYEKDLSQILKSFLLPVQMLKIAEHYLSSKKGLKQPFAIDYKRYYLINYVLLASKITYEQDDYYAIFGKDSNIFERISIVRNSIAHDNFEFLNKASVVNNIDRTKSLTEPIDTSISILTTVDDQKELIMKMKKTSHSPESIASLTEKLKSFFDIVFNNENTLEDSRNLDL